MDINSLKIKTYIEDEYKLAYAKARKELGPDLVIVDKKEVKEGGIFGLFGKKRIKVTFGIEKFKSKKLEQEKEMISAIRDIAKKHMDDSEINLNKIENKDSFQPLFQKVVKENKLRENSEESKNIGTYSPFVKDEKKSIENIQKELNINIGEIEPLKYTNNKLYKKNDIESEDIQALKRELEKELNKDNYKNQEKKLDFQINDFDLIEKLRDNDIPKEIAYDINMYFEKNKYDKKEMYTGLKNYFRQYIKVKHERKDKKFVMLIGPTGVGKTTTCAKIVANNWKNEKKVGFITADTYRLEAVSQLKAYANIMRVPIEVVKKPEDLNLVIEKFRHKDLILMDTAGRSPKNKEQMKELKAYVESKGDNMETILVLSATSHLSVILETIEKFEKIGFDSIIMTKLDETSNTSSLLSIMKKYNYPLYYVTNGQSVPDDIEICTEEMLTEIFIKGIK